MVKFEDKISNETETWHFKTGLDEYLVQSLNGYEMVPETPFGGIFEGRDEQVSWSSVWLSNGGERSAKAMST